MTDERTAGEGTDLTPHLSVALYLTVVSVLEYQIAGGRHVGATWLGWVLIGFLCLKLLGVSLVYMRLHREPPWLQGSLGVVVGLALYSGWVLSVSAPAIPTGRPESGVLVAGRPACGQQVCVTYGCVSCHNIPGVSHLPAGLGPDLDGVADRAALRKPGQGADAYIRESILDPSAYIVRGYLPWMPALRDRMTRQEFEDLVAFLETLHQKK